MTTASKATKDPQFLPASKIKELKESAKKALEITNKLQDKNLSNGVRKTINDLRRIIGEIKARIDDIAEYKIEKSAIPVPALAAPELRKENKAGENDIDKTPVKKAQEGEIKNRKKVGENKFRKKLLKFLKDFFLFLRELD